MNKIKTKRLDSVNKYFAYEGIYILFFIMASCLTIWSFCFLDKHLIELMMASFLIFIPFIMISGIAFRKGLINSVKKNDSIILKTGVIGTVKKINEKTFVIKSGNEEFEVVKGIIFENINRK